MPRILAGQQTVLVRRFENTVAAQVQAILDKAQHDLIALIATRSPADVTAARRMVRIASLTKESDDILTAAYSSINAITRDALVAVAKLGSRISAQSIEKMLAAVGSAQTTSLPTTAVLRALATNTPIQGDVMFGWWQKQKTATRNGFRRAITQGVVRGENTSSIIARVRGTENAAGKMVGGIMNASRREATTLVRTALMDVNNRGAMETYRENSDIIQGFECLAILDERTCDECGNLDGQVFAIDDPAAPMYPLHYQCRCTTIPVVNYKALGVKPPDPTERLTYQDWFGKQDQQTQNDILGPGKADLVRSGAISFSDLVREDGSSIPLKDLVQ